MIHISDIPDLHRFLSFLCIQFRNTQYPTGLSSPYLDSCDSNTDKPNQDDLDDLSFSLDQLSSYVITGREPIPNFDYRTTLVIFTETPKRDCFFEPNDYFLINSNLGLFLAHTDEMGCFREFELHFSESLFPSFIPALIKSLPVDQDEETPSKLLREILKTGVVQVDQLESDFQEKEFATIEVE